MHGGMKALFFNHFGSQSAAPAANGDSQDHTFSGLKLITAVPERLQSIKRKFMKSKRNPIHIWLLWVAMLQAASSGAQSLTFTNSSTNAVESGPCYVAVADVNGDGSLDLICANYGYRGGMPGVPGGWLNTLTVLTNNGSGTFSSQATLTVGYGPITVVAADVNGDGLPDLISVNETDNTLTVLTNNGGGGFGSNATIAVGNEPIGLVAIDINSVGKLDLICSNFKDNTLTVLTNNGRGVFGSNATLNVGTGPYCLVAADVNGDGRPDLICNNETDSTLTVLTNNGSGGFGSNATLTVGLTPDCVRVADVNGDGRPDLISVNWGAGTMTVLTNDGRGGFCFNATLTVGSYPSSVAVGDFNGDGRVDLICANTPGGGIPGTLTVYTNNGSGVFGYNGTLTVGSIPNVFAADLTGDGKMDLITPNFWDDTITVLLNTSVFPPPTLTPSLTIHLQGNEARVSWPSPSPGWELQQNTVLNELNWLPSGYNGYGIADDGTNKSLITPFPRGNMFFRLLHP
jgi:hypothetical protein